MCPDGEPGPPASSLPGPGLLRGSAAVPIGVTIAAGTAEAHTLRLYGDGGLGAHPGRGVSREGRVIGRRDCFKSCFESCFEYVLNHVLSVFWYELRRHKHFDLANSQSIPLWNRIPEVCGVRS